MGASTVGKACICDEDRRLRYIARLREYACAIFSMGDMIEYTPGSVNDLFFWPNGHNVRVTEDAEIIIFSPQREHTHVIDHMREKLKSM